MNSEQLYELKMKISHFTLFHEDFCTSFGNFFFLKSVFFYKVYKYINKEENLRIRIIFLAVFFLCGSSALSFQKVKNLSLSAEGIEKLEIDCGAGFLKVYGIESLREIEVTAEIVVEGKNEKRAQEFISENVKLDLEKRGSKAVLVSKIKQGFSLFSFRKKVINLTVNVPKNIDLDIDDSSGAMNIESIIGQVDIDDSSGSIHVENIRGNVTIDDSSGGIDVEDVSGYISIDDSSGSIYITNIGENVTLSDGSGSINIDGVGGDVILKEDGSGKVKIRNVKGKIIR